MSIRTECDKAPPPFLDELDQRLAWAEGLYEGLARLEKDPYLTETERLTDDEMQQAATLAERMRSTFDFIDQAMSPHARMPDTFSDLQLIYQF